MYEYVCLFLIYILLYIWREGGGLQIHLSIYHLSTFPSIDLFRETYRDVPSTGSLPKWAQRLGLDQIKTNSLEPLPDFPHGRRGIQ